MHDGLANTFNIFGIERRAQMSERAQAIAEERFINKESNKSVGYLVDK